MPPSRDPAMREAKLCFAIKSHNFPFHREQEPAANTDNGMLCYLSGPPNERLSIRGVEEGRIGHFEGSSPIYGNL